MGYAHGLSLATESVLQQASQALAETVGAYRGITSSASRSPCPCTPARPRPTSSRWPPGRQRRSPEAHGLHFIVDGSVLDLSVVEPSKAAALEHLRSMLGVSAALYAGRRVQR